MTTLGAAAAAVGLSTSREIPQCCMKSATSQGAASCADSGDVRASFLGVDGPGVAAGVALLALRSREGLRAGDVAAAWGVSRQYVESLEGSTTVSDDAIRAYRDAVGRAHEVRLEAATAVLNESTGR